MASWEDAWEQNNTEFQPGVEVRIRRDSQYARQSTLIGVIQPFNEGIPVVGWVSVRFPDTSNSYRVGLPAVDGGICDLELAYPIKKIPEKTVGSIYG